MKKIIPFLFLLLSITLSVSAQKRYTVMECRWGPIPNPWAAPDYYTTLPNLNKANVVHFTKKDTNAFITSCDIDTAAKIIYYYHCYGGLFSFLPIVKSDLDVMLEHHFSPFDYYDLVVNDYAAVIENAKQKLQAKGTHAKFNADEKGYTKITDSVKFPSTLTKLLELDRQLVDIEAEATRFHSVNPKYIVPSEGYGGSFWCPYGQMILWHTTDTVVTFYNKLDEMPVFKAMMNINKGVIYYYSRNDNYYERADYYDYNGNVVDELPISKEKINLILKEKFDVFALYRIWLEWQRQIVTDAMQQTEQRASVVALKKYAINDWIAQSKTLAVIDSKINYCTHADQRYVLQHLRKDFAYSIPAARVWETGRMISHTTGDKRYEIRDHRGNVMVVISDKKRGIPRKDNPALIDHYEAIVLSATDYTSFGKPMEGRSFNTGSYPYGFNDKRNDPETGYQDYGMRIYDPQVGRFISPDPLKDKYPELSSYQFASNSPISGVDEDGLEWAYYNKDNTQVNINSSTSNADKLSITGVRWAGYDKDANGNNIPKAGTVPTAYTFGLKGMTTSSLNSKGDGVQIWQSYSSLSTGNKQADKNIQSLDPRVQDDMKELVLMRRLRFGLDVRGAELGGYRTYAVQDALYAKGRTKLGGIVTKAPGGFSNHNFALAMDVKMYDNGKYLSTGNEWQYALLGEVGETKIGLTWGGNQQWKDLGIFDPAHFQNMQGFSMRQLRALPKDQNGFIIIPKQ